jgi:glutamine amidotransferase-like uncharacterized protein
MNIDIKNFIKNLGVFLGYCRIVFYKFSDLKFLPSHTKETAVKEESIEYVSDISYEQAVINTVKAANDS